MKRFSSPNLKSTMKKKIAFLGIAVIITTGLKAQIYFPQPPGTTSNGNVGVNVSNPQSRFHVSDITQFNQCEPGILMESSYSFTLPQSGGGGGEVPPEDCTTPFAFRNNTLSNGVKTTTFNVGANGQTFIGNLQSNSAINSSTLSVERSLGIYESTTDFIRLEHSLLFGNNSSSLIWNNSNDAGMNFIYGSAGTYNNIMTLMPNNMVGINTIAPEAALHIVSNLQEPNSGESGQIQGLLIENNGHRNHDFALEIRTGQRPPDAPMDNGRVFTVSNAGTVHIGPKLNWGTPGESPDAFKLYVQGGIRTERVKVDVASLNDWADYVFDADYVLMSTEELEAYIKKHKHLPGVPSAEDVVRDGIDLAEMNKILLEKIEELTLRVIELEKDEL